MFIPNFAFDVIYTGNKKKCNKNNISLMFKKVLFNDFESMLLQKLKASRYNCDHLTKNLELLKLFL